MTLRLMTILALLAAVVTAHERLPRYSAGGITPASQAVLMTAPVKLRAALAKRYVVL